MRPSTRPIAWVWEKTSASWARWMACGVPVIASAVGGLPEVIAQGETGFLAPVGAVDAMAAEAAAILSDPARHARMRSAAARRALDFSAERIVPQYEALYRDVLNG